MRGNGPEGDTTGPVRNEGNVYLSKAKVKGQTDAENTQQKLMSKSFSNLAQPSNEILDKPVEVLYYFKSEWNAIKTLNA